MESPLPSREQLKRTGLEILRTAGRIITLRAFLPEEPFASHGDHPFDEYLDEPIVNQDVSGWGFDYNRWDDMGNYIERTDVAQQGFDAVTKDEA